MSSTGIAVTPGSLREQSPSLELLILAQSGHSLPRGETRSEFCPETPKSTPWTEGSWNKGLSNILPLYSVVHQARGSSHGPSARSQLGAIVAVSQLICVEVINWWLSHHSPRVIGAQFARHIGKYGLNSRSASIAARDHSRVQNRGSWAPAMHVSGASLTGVPFPLAWESIATSKMARLVVPASSR